MVMKDLTQDELKEAKRKYDYDWCIITDMADDPEVEMVGRKPSDQDFLYVARLWYRQGSDVAGDLELSTPEYHRTVVLNPATKPGNNAAPDWSLLHPVELELAHAPVDPETKARLNDLLDRTGLSDQYEHEYEAEQARQRAEFIKSLRVVKNPEFVRWDDDAYGFVIIR